MLLNKFSGIIHSINTFYIYNNYELENRQFYCKGDKNMDTKSAMLLQIVNLIMGIIRSLIESGNFPT